MAALDSCSNRSERSLGPGAPRDVSPCAEHLLTRGNVSMSQSIHPIQGSMSGASLRSLHQHSGQEGTKALGLAGWCHMP